MEICQNRFNHYTLWGLSIVLNYNSGNTQLSGPHNCIVASNSDDIRTLFTGNSNGFFPIHPVTKGVTDCMLYVMYVILFCRDFSEEK